MSYYIRFRPFPQGAGSDFYCLQKIHKIFVLFCRFAVRKQFERKRRNGHTRQDGVTRDKRLKLKLNNWGYAPAAQRQEQYPNHAQDDPIPEVIDGEREALPE